MLERGDGAWSHVIHPVLLLDVFEILHLQRSFTRTESKETARVR